MKLLLLNIFVLIIVATPLFMLEWLEENSRWSSWIREHEGVSIVVWFVTLFLVYVFVLPFFHLRPNPAIFQNLP